MDNKTILWVGNQPAVMPLAKANADESDSPNSRCGEIPQPPVKSEWERMSYHGVYVCARVRTFFFGKILPRSGG